MSANPRTFTVLAAGGQIGADNKQWIEVMPTADKAKNGPWLFTITRDDLETYATSIRSNPDAIPVDYDHAGADPGGSTRAAGWFTGQARVDDTSDRGPILLAEVQWTPSGAEAVRNGDFKMISPEFDFHVKDAKTGLLTRARRLIAATLTNRPFFRQLAPVASELDDDAIAALAKHFDEDPMEIATLAAATDEPYGNVEYADPGLQKDGKKRYPLDTDEHIRAAWDYINKAKNAAKYSSEQLAKIKTKIRAAMKRIGADVTATDEGDIMDLKVIAAALGLAEDATDEQITAAAEAAKKNAADAETLKAENEQLKAQATDGDRIKKLEDELAAERKLRISDRKETILAKAVADRRIDPAAKEVLAEQFGDNVDGLEKVLATYTPKPGGARGSGGAGKDGDDDSRAAARAADEFEYESEAGRRVTADDDELALHVKAEKILADRGKHSPTAAEYADAYDEASRVTA